MTIFILVLIAVIIGVILIVALISPKDYSITAETTIDRSSDVVFNYIKLIRNQEKYSKWVMADPNIKMEYKGTDGTVGFAASWQSDVRDVGTGTQEIKKIIEDKGYEVEIRFEKPFEGISRAETIAEPISEGKTKVTNTFYTSTPFPMNLMNPLIKKTLTKDMQTNLANLKRNLEA